MSNGTKKWSELKDDDLWLFEKPQKSDLEYAEIEIKNLRIALQNANSENDDLLLKTAAQLKTNAKLSDALSGLIEIIQSAGLINLCNGVQLGPTVWFVKASESMNYAEAILRDSLPLIASSLSEMSNLDTEIKQNLKEQAKRFALLEGKEQALNNVLELLGIKQECYNDLFDNVESLRKQFDDLKSNLNETHNCLCFTANYLGSEQYVKNKNAIESVFKKETYSVQRF